MEKVKLPREVAEELTAIIQHESYPIRYVVDVFENDLADVEIGALKEYFESDRSRRIEIIMKALVIGFEVESTPEEQAIQWMIKRKCIARGFSEHDIVMAIKSILNQGVIEQ